MSNTKLTLNDVAVRIRANRDRDSHYAHIHVEFWVPDPYAARIGDYRRVDGYLHMDLNGLELYELELTAQMDNHTDWDVPEPVSYGHKLSYREGGSYLEFRRVERMYKTLAKAEKGFDRLIQERGTAKTFGQFCLYYLNALKIKRFQIYNVHTQEWRDVKPGDFVWTVDRTVEKLRRELLGLKEGDPWPGGTKRDREAVE